MSNPPREFWINKSLLDNEGIGGVAQGEPDKCFTDRCGVYHVIEKSAYDELEKEFSKSRHETAIWFTEKLPKLTAALKCAKDALEHCAKPIVFTVSIGDHSEYEHEHEMYEPRRPAIEALKQIEEILK